MYGKYLYIFGVLWAKAGLAVAPVAPPHGQAWAAVKGPQAEATMGLAALKKKIYTYKCLKYINIHICKYIYI